MATFDYSKINTTALNLITKFGTTFTIERTGDGGDWTKKFNPATQRYYWEDSEANIVTTAPTDTAYEYSGVCVLSNYRTEEIDGTLIQQGDKKLIAKISTAIPSPNDVITVDSVSYRYINHKTVAPDADPIIYLIQVRI